MPNKKRKYLDEQYNPYPIGYDNNIYKASYSLPEVKVFSPRPNWQHNLTDYDLTRLKSGQITSNTAKSIAEKRATGTSQFIKDVNKLAWIPNGAMALAGGMSLAAAPQAANILMNTIGVEAVAEALKNKDYKGAATEAALNFMPLGVIGKGLSKLPKKNTLKLAKALRELNNGRLVNPYNNTKTNVLQFDGVTRDIPAYQYTTQTYNPLQLPNQYEANKEFLNRVNDYFYNYEPIPLTDDYLRDTDKLEKAVKDRIAQHNTFLRGVRDPKDNVRANNLEEVNAILREQGIEPTKENRLIYAATHYAGNTGHGRAGLSSKGQGTLYTSNSINTASGYASTSNKVPIGEIAVVRRPYSLGLDRNKWLEEGDFLLYDSGNKTIRKNSKTILRSDNPDIVDYLNRFKKDKVNTATKADIQEQIDLYNKARVNKYIKEVNEINNILLNPNNKIDVSSFERPLKLNPTIKEQLYTSNLLDKLRARNSVYGSEYPAYRLDPSKKQGYVTVKGKKRRELDMLGYYDNDNFFQEITSDLLPYSEVSLNPSNLKYLMKKSKVTGKQMRDAGYEKHLAVNRAKSNKFAFTTEGRHIGVKGGDNYQHYVFVGPKGEKGLEFVEFLPREEWVPFVENATRAHIGRSSNKFSQKTFASGGRIYIKPENRGKFTALKERTGHSASWFKENGTPAQKKMAVFALNSRKWKH